MCGLFGVVNYGNKVDRTTLDNMIHTLAKQSEARGTDAGGISFFANNTIVTKKAPNQISKSGVLVPAMLDSKVIMGHTRQTTQGDAKRNYNNHPFVGEQNRYAMAHNGILYNDYSLASKYNLPKTKVETDSYVVVRLLDKIYNGDINFASLRGVAESLSGSFNLTFVDKKHNLWIVRKDNPLTIYNIKEMGIIVYASMTNTVLYALDELVGGDDIIDYLMQRKSTKAFGEPVKCVEGDILKIAPNGSIERQTFKPNEDTYLNHLKFRFNDAFEDDYPRDEYQEATQFWYEYANASKVKTSSTTETSIVGSVGFVIPQSTIFYNGKELEATHTIATKDTKSIFSRYLGGPVVLSANEEMSVPYITDERRIQNFYSLFDIEDALYYPSSPYMDTIRAAYDAIDVRNDLVSNAGTGVNGAVGRAILLKYDHNLPFRSALRTFLSLSYFFEWATWGSTSNDQLSAYCSLIIDDLFTLHQSVYNLMSHIQNFTDYFINRLSDLEASELVENLRDC